MAQKDGINACFRVFFVVLVVAVLAQSSCIDKARGSVGRNLMGGWRAVENPEDVVVVKGIVDSGLKQYNQQSNDLHNFELVENGKIEAYTQVRDSLDVADELAVTRVFLGFRTIFMFHCTVIIR